MTKLTLLSLSFFLIALSASTELFGYTVVDFPDPNKVYSCTVSRDAKWTSSDEKYKFELRIHCDDQRSSRYLGDGIASATIIKQAMEQGFLLKGCSFDSAAAAYSLGRTPYVQSKEVEACFFVSAIKEQQLIQSVLKKPPV